MQSSITYYLLVFTNLSKMKIPVKIKSPANHLKHLKGCDINLPENKLKKTLSSYLMRPTYSDAKT